MPRRQRRLHQDDRRVDLARHRHRNAEFGALPGAGGEGAVDGGAHAGVASAPPGCRRRRRRARRRWRGGPGGPAPQHQQRVGQRLDDRLVGAQQPADLGGAGGERAGQPPIAAPPVRSGTRRGVAAARDGSVAALQRGHGAASRPADAGRGRIARPAQSSPARWPPAPPVPAARHAAARQQRQQGDRRHQPGIAAAARGTRPRASPQMPGVLTDAGAGSIMLAPAWIDREQRQPAPHVPSVCKASSAIGAGEPWGWHRAATEKFPSAASTRDRRGVEGEVRHPRPARRRISPHRPHRAGAHAGIGGGVPGAVEVGALARGGAAHRVGPITCTVGVSMS